MPIRPAAWPGRRRIRRSVTMGGSTWAHGAGRSLRPTAVRRLRTPVRTSTTPCSAACTIARRPRGSPSATSSGPERCGGSPGRPSGAFRRPCWRSRWPASGVGRRRRGDQRRVARHLARRDLLGLGLWLAGVVGLAALAASTAVRPWGLVAVVATIAGTVLVAPVLGSSGWPARPCCRTAEVIGAEPAGSLQAQFLDGRWAGGWSVVGFALLGARRDRGGRGDPRVAGAQPGRRLAGAARGRGRGRRGVPVLGVHADLAAMVMLAATLGLAWTVSRLSPDGDLTGAD